MTTRLHHELIYRGKDQLARLAKAKIIICGAGALGSNLTSNLTRQGFKALTVIDKDRVEQQNLSTQIYSVDDVGGMKADMLKNIVYRDVGEEIESIGKELTAANVGKILRDCDVVVDGFDNSTSRGLVTKHCKEKNLQCLHVGVNGDFGEVRWNENYMVPSNAGDDVCDYPLARNLIMIMTAVAGEVLIRFLLDGVKENYSITLGDLKINFDGETR